MYASVYVYVYVCVRVHTHVLMPCIAHDHNPQQEQSHHNALVENITYAHPLH